MLDLSTMLQAIEVTPAHASSKQQAHTASHDTKRNIQQGTQRQQRRWAVLMVAKQRSRRRGRDARRLCPSGAGGGAGAGAGAADDIKFCSRRNKERCAGSGVAAVRQLYLLRTDNTDKGSFQDCMARLTSPKFPTILRRNILLFL